MSVREVPRAEPNTLSLNRLGLWLFFLSESMIFVILLTTRFVLLGGSRPEDMNQTLGLILTTVLLLSSVTAYQAETAIAHDNRRVFLLCLLLTMALGLLFLVGVVGIEWREAGAMGIVPESGFGMVFYAMTGMHALHVLSGVIFLSLVYRNGRRGSYSAGGYWGVEACVKYWHFVDLVWVFFFPALYLIF
jgi:cytochrome c oxidase subunit 3